MNNMIPRKAVIIIAIDLIILAIILIGAGNRILLITLLLWINMVTYCISNISERCQVLVFLIAFFLFLMGRQLLETYGLHKTELEFSEELNEFSEKLIFISLVSFSSFVLFFNGLRIRFFRGENTIAKTENDIYSRRYYKTIRTYSKYGFYFTYLFGIYSIIKIVLFVFSNGYLAYYSSFKNNTPYVIEKLGELSVLFFWIFVSTMPTRREIAFPTVLFLLREIMTLGTGQRFEFIAALLTISVYFAMRNVIHTGNKLWVSKRMIMVAIILMPLGMILMGFHNYIRFGSSGNFDHISDILVDFVYRQGVTANVLKRYKLYEMYLNNDKLYMFSNTNNIIRNGLFGTLLELEKFTGNSIEYASRGSSLAHTLSYVVLGTRYLQGEGLGSSYIAESFHDASYFGVVIANAFYAFLLTKVLSVRRRSIWGFTLSLMMLSAILFAIRGETDGVTSVFLNASTWVIFLVLHLLGKESEDNNACVVTLGKDTYYYES